MRSHSWAEWSIKAFYKMASLLQLLARGLMVLVLPHDGSLKRGASCAQLPQGRNVLRLQSTLLCERRGYVGVHSDGMEQWKQ
jgi:hypothetical protein